MTVGVSTIFDGYDEISSPSKGVISSNTFDVGGVQYIVANVGFEKGTNNRFALHVAPALPFDSFTLTLGSTDLLSSSASVTVDTDGNGLYTWSGTDPNWTDGQMVDVKLEVPLINICGRSPALAYAIKAATPSYDFCHVTSQLDLAGITELDLSGVVPGRPTTPVAPGHIRRPLQPDAPGHQRHQPAELVHRHIRGPGQPDRAGPQPYPLAPEWRARGRFRRPGQPGDSAHRQLKLIKNLKRWRPRPPGQGHLQGPGQPAGTGCATQQAAPGRATVLRATDQPGDVQRPVLHPARRRRRRT